MVLRHLNKYVKYLMQSGGKYKVARTEFIQAKEFKYILNIKIQYFQQKILSDLIYQH